MKRVLSIITVGCLLIACKSQLIDNTGIKLITIEVNKRNDSQKYNITSTKKAVAIVNELNHCTKEPVYFKSNYTLAIIYKNGSQRTAFCNGDSMMIDGVTYKIDKYIEEIIK